MRNKTLPAFGEVNFACFGLCLNRSSSEVMQFTGKCHHTVTAYYMDGFSKLTYATPWMETPNPQVDSEKGANSDPGEQ